MTQRLFIALCLFIPAYAAHTQQPEQQKAAQAALRVIPPSAPIAIPKTKEPTKQAPWYDCLGTQYGTSPQVTPGSTPVGTPPTQIKS